MKNTNIAPEAEKSTALYSRVRRKPSNTFTNIENKETHAYKWTIETALGTFSGTCLSMNDLNEEITLLTNNSKIFKKNIIPLTLKDENIRDKTYTWYVTTNSGQVSGVSLSLEDAKKAINSFGYNEVIHSNIVESAVPSKII